MKQLSILMAESNEDIPTNDSSIFSFDIFTSTTSQLSNYQMKLNPKQIATENNLNLSPRKQSFRNLHSRN